jgi:glycosyltransferase involved in cell wall biosynthesis
MQRVEDPRVLAEIYRQHDIFVMPSFLETFGVVYIEALSQGLPIVFSRGQAVDGYFAPGTVGEPVDPHDAESVQRAVLSIAARLDTLRPQCVAAARDFAWSSIAQRYVGLYRDALAVEKRGAGHGP